MIEKGLTLKAEEILCKQVFTKHPPRYSEASLIKKMEDSGIGRPSTFAETDDNGIWIPKDSSDVIDAVTFGTNGFFFNFQQTGTSANSSGMGADTSGNDNHFAIGGDPNFTAVNIMPDTPTNNWANLNGQGATDSQGATGTLSSGNLVMGTNQKAQGLTIDNINENNNDTPLAYDAING